MRVHVPLSSRTRVFAHLKLPFFGVVNDNTLSKLLLNSHAGGFHLANAPRIMRNFAPRFRKTHPKKLLFFVNSMFIHPYIQQKYFHMMRKYRNGRQNASSFCASIVTADKVTNASGWNTLTADKVQDAARWRTPTADRVLGTIAEILSRPTEYFRNLRKQYNSRQNASTNWWNTITAEKVPNTRA